MNSGKLPKNLNNNEQQNIINDEKERRNIKSNLTCSIMNLNYFDNKDNIFGYPILQYKKSVKNKIELYPIPELVSYKGFINKFGNFKYKLEDYYDNNNNDIHYNNVYNNDEAFYNYWMPIYIDKNHFEKTKNTILYTFTIIKSGISNITEYNFESLHFFEIFEIIIHKLIKGILNDNTQISNSFIECFFHYVLLFKKLSTEFDDEFCKYLNNKFNLIHKNGYKINKTILPNVQNMIILLYFCNRNIYTEKMKKIWYCLFEEFLLRNMTKNFEGNKMKEILNKIATEIVNENNPEFSEMFLNVFFKGNFVDKLKYNDVYYKVYELILSDEIFLSKYNWTKNYAKLKLGEIIRANFKKIYYEDISKDTQKQLYDIIFDIILKDLHSRYFYHDRIEYDKIKTKYQAKIRDTKVSEILNYISKNKNKDIIKEFIFCAYESLKDNKILLLSFFFLQKKMKEKDFIENLEKNYGICVDIDNIKKEIKEKLKEIKTYKQLFEYVGSEFGKNEDDIDIIINKYEKAKKIGLVENDNKNKLNIRESPINNIERGRGRGRGRGERGRVRGRGRGRERRG